MMRSPRSASTDSNVPVSLTGPLFLPATPRSPTSHAFCPPDLTRPRDVDNYSVLSGARPPSARPTASLRAEQRRVRAQQRLDDAVDVERRVMGDRYDARFDAGSPAFWEDAERRFWVGNGTPRKGRRRRVAAWVDRLNERFWWYCRAAFAG